MYLPKSYKSLIRTAFCGRQKTLQNVDNITSAVLPPSPIEAHNFEEKNK